MKVKFYLLLLFTLPVQAGVFNLFGPVTGVLKGSASTYQTSASTSSDIAGLWIGSGCSGVVALQLDGSCQTITATSFANPTSKIGLTVINGSATTAMRSDAAQALDQTISPTMTGNWIFEPSANQPVRIAGASGSDALEVTGTDTSALTMLITNTGGSGLRINAGTSSSNSPFNINNGAVSSNLFTVLGDGGITIGAPTGGDEGAGTLNIGTGAFKNGSAYIAVADSPTATGSWTFTPSATIAITINAASGNFAQKILGPTSGTSEGLLIEAGTSSGSDFPLNIQNAAGNLDLFDVVGNGGIRMKNIASSSTADTGALCWNSTVGLVTTNESSTCLTSSEKYKKNVTSLALKHGLFEVLRLHPVSYVYNDDSMKFGEQVGLLAENVKAVDPRMVSYNRQTGELEGVRYLNLIAVLVSAIKQVAAINFVWLLLLSLGWGYHQVTLRALQRQLDSLCG